VTEHRFDGRVAIITGAGRGIGRSYARLLAARGARVVVNDLGANTRGVGTDEAVAQAVVQEIGAEGGEALADAGDVSTEVGAAATVQAAIDQFGRVDILVHNAGIVRWAAMPDIDPDDFAATLAVHLHGAFHLTRAAWPHMVEQRHGRIVLTTSTGMLGLPNNTSYAAAKAGVIGVARSLALAGAPHGINVNCIAPAAMTRMSGRAADDAGPEMSPDLVAPMGAFLAHDDCRVTGEIYTAGFGRFARVFVGSTEGWVSQAAPTIEDVAAHWTAINDESGYSVPADLMSWSADFMSHLPSPAGGAGE
jgi:NAD(P)-dependent dehydrogenase (short-subunit alcohol dehydrogenase family)